MNCAYRLSTALFAVWLCLGGCNESSAVGAQAVPSSSAPLDAAAPRADASPVQPVPPAPRARVPMELLGLTITSGVEKKEPVDKLKSVAPSARVYVHLKMRNRSSETRTVHVDFLINGKLRTPLKLDVEPSWSYRTWGYNTLQAGDSGELEVQVYDDAGTMLERIRLPIKSK
jgi:hypothetical protein